MRHRDFGLLAYDEHRTTGFTLFSPLHGKSTYLLGMRGEIVHQWEHPITTGTYGYLLDTGNLLWAGRLPEGPQHMGGRGGLLREYDWNGKVVWEHRHVGQHHDFRRLPGGNTVFLGWEIVPPEIAKRVPGGLPGTCHPDGCMYGDFIFEVNADGKSFGNGTPAAIWRSKTTRSAPAKIAMSLRMPTRFRRCPMETSAFAASAPSASSIGNPAR